MRGHFGIVFHAQSNGEVTVQNNWHGRRQSWNLGINAQNKALDLQLGSTFSFLLWATAYFLTNEIKVFVKVSSKSASIYSDLTIGLGMKNYPQMTPHMPYWLWLIMKNYPKMTPHMSYFVDLFQGATWYSHILSKKYIVSHSAKEKESLQIIISFHLSLNLPLPTTWILHFFRNKNGVLWSQARTRIEMRLRCYLVIWSLVINNWQ